MTPTTTSTRYLRTTTSCRSSASSAESRSSTRWWPSAATTSARSARCSTTRRARGATPAGCRPTESSILPKKLLQGWRNRSMRPTSPTTTTMTTMAATKETIKTCRFIFCVSCSDHLNEQNSVPSAKLTRINFVKPTSELGNDLVAMPTLPAWNIISWSFLWRFRSWKSFKREMVAEAFWPEVKRFGVWDSYYKRS